MLALSRIRHQKLLFSLFQSFKYFKYSMKDKNVRCYMHFWLTWNENFPLEVELIRENCQDYSYSSLVSDEIVHFRFFFPLNLLQGSLPVLEFHYRFLHTISTVFSFISISFITLLYVLKSKKEYKVQNSSYQ